MALSLWASTSSVPLAKLGGFPFSVHLPIAHLEGS